MAGPIANWFFRTLWVAPIAVALAVPRETDVAAVHLDESAVAQDAALPAPVLKNEEEGGLSSYVSTYREGDLLTRLLLSVLPYTALAFTPVAIRFGRGRVWKSQPATDAFIRHALVYMRVRHYIRDRRPIGGEMEAFLVQDALRLLKECDQILINNGLTTVATVHTLRKSIQTSQIHADCQTWIPLLEESLRRFAATRPANYDAEKSAEAQIDKSYALLGLKRGCLYNIADVQSAFYRVNLAKQASVGADWMASRAVLSELQIAVLQVSHDLGLNTVPDNWDDFVALGGC